MASTDRIPAIEVVDPAPGQFRRSLNIAPILHEVRHAVRRLIDTGEGTTIDLQSIPLMPGEAEAIRGHLGTGEVLIHIDALGGSTLSETAFSGVWWVEHRNSVDEITGRYIDISVIPEIVLPVEEDLLQGLTQLGDYLSREVQFDEE